MKYLGCAYYPEYWGPARVETDAKLMREAGINLARIGEFAWCRMEPEDGRFTLDWLHHSLETLGQYGVNVLMCTPTAAPPAWLTAAYPETCLVRANGTRLVHGARRHYCPTSDTYRRFSARITDVLSRELARHKNLVAWQLDNELWPEMGWCNCEHCRARFQTWLQARYGTLETLNQKWGTGFWSMDYSDWRQIRLTEGTSAYPASNLDTRRFRNEMMIEFALQQAEIIRRNQPQTLVTTNGMGPLHTSTNIYQFFGKLDVACDDLYFDIATMDADVVAMNVFRSVKPGRPFWITETGSGALDQNKPPHPAQFRAWAWSSLAHGADGYLIFRWRTCLSGQEQELQGILEHSGAPRQRYQTVQTCFLELRKQYEQLKALPLPEAPVAFIVDFESLWAYESSRVERDVDCPGGIYWLHKALWRRNVVADFVPPDRDLSAYKLVILPSMVIIQPDFAKRLSAYVENGGTVLALGQIGMRDFNNSYLPYPGPDHLQDLLGVTLEGGTYLTSHMEVDEALWVPANNSRKVQVDVTGRLGGKAVAGKASAWVADTALHGGQTLLNFSSDAYAGQPALVKKQTGKGTAFYLGALRVNGELLDALLDHSLDAADVKPGLKTPENVEAVRRGDVLFLVNHTPKPVSVDLGRPGTALVGACAGSTAELGPYGVCVLRGWHG